MGNSSGSLVFTRLTRIYSTQCLLLPHLLSLSLMPMTSWKTNMTETPLTSLKANLMEKTESLNQQPLLYRKRMWTILTLPQINHHIFSLTVVNHQTLNLLFSLFIFRLKYWSSINILNGLSRN